jgi:aspartyl-tRNA(Asn)/glutamyl-tRNA(Gln) amidotransferase subunit A
LPTFDSVQEKLTSKKTSVEELTKNFLQIINEKRNLNAFLNVFDRKAIRRAQEVDKKIANGNAGSLAGMVMASKDNICFKDEVTTCGSKILQDFVSLYDATAIERLKNADVVFVGKTNLDEFAMGSSTENSAYGTVLNPHDKTRVPGGSSGGSAVAVAANMCVTALGSDTGGSVRQPAALCGVIGLKPTYGRVSRYGLVAYGSSLDQIGIFGNTSRDVARVLQVIAGHDEHDSTSANVDVPNYLEALNKNISGLNIGIPKEYFTDGLDEEIRKTIFLQIEKLKSLGATVKEISTPNAEYVIPTYYIIAMAEASSNLSRFDGARYGYRAENVKNLHDMYVRSRSEGFGDEVKRRIMVGTYVLSAGYYDAYYRKAQQVRRLIYNDFINAYKDVDIIVSPATPTTAFKIGEKSNDPVQMYLEDVYTVSANLAGIPAITIRAGKDERGLPIGFQLYGKHFDEATILKVADCLE